MKASSDIRDFIKMQEGFCAVAKKCPAGVWTIGYGHAIGVRPGETITREKADTLLSRDLLMVENYLNAESYTYLLSQNEFDALVSFIFNVGIGKFAKSTMRRLLKQGARELVPAQFVRWVYAGGKKLLGLQRRRVSEANRFANDDLYFVNSRREIEKY